MTEKKLRMLQKEAKKNPTRQAILGLLANCDRLTPKEISGMLGSSPSTAAYHCGVLARAKLVSRTKTELGKGTAQFHYAAIREPAQAS